ncbi:MAG: ABC transporter ATP-binding protein, partial [Planctomycetes bacterium]|nr:ABC transporter ATP-binding protein [Planctomycetota bacterium]
ILALGTLAELAREFGESDLEELFFGLIQRHDAEAMELGADTRTATV